MHAGLKFLSGSLSVRYCLRQISSERHDRVVRTVASYSVGPGFKSWPGDRLAGLRLFGSFLSLLRRMSGQYFEIRSRPLPSKSSFTFRPIIRRCKPSVLVTEKMSLKKLQTKKNYA
jgi:hypothetical protein